MEFFNFSDKEINTIKKALTFTSKKELDTSYIPNDLPVIKTENYLSECEQFLDPERTLGTENPSATVVFPNAKTATHKVLVNQEKIHGISYVHAITGELIHLCNFSQYFKDNGHLYTFSQEKMIERYYYEMLLWSIFQAKKISTRTFSLMLWHEKNGEDPPPDGRYQFEGISIDDHGLHRSLGELTAADSVPALREIFWVFLEELALYFGVLAFYQQEPEPSAVDENFPAEQLDTWFGLEHVLKLYGLLLRTPDYAAWQENRQAIRQCILLMEKQSKATFLHQSASAD